MYLASLTVPTLPRWCKLLWMSLLVSLRAGAPWLGGVGDGVFAGLEAPLRGLDGLRRLGLRALGTTGGALWRDRELRVAVLGSLAVLASLALTCAAPLWLLALGPILLGVPHLFADLRYLVLRPGLHRRLGLWLLALPPLLVVATGGRPAIGFLAIGAAALAARAGWRRRLPVLGLAFALCGLALCYPQAVTLWLAQLHNYVALAFFLWWRRRRGALHALPALLILLGSAALLLGGAEPLLQRSGGLYAPQSGVDMETMVATLAPDAAPRLGLRLVLLFAFAQSVHYGLWLRLIPEEDRPRPAPRPFVASLRALRADLGTPVCLLAVLASAGLCLYGLWDVQAAREGYLRVAVGHGYLEFTAAALLLCEGRRPAAAEASGA